MIWVQHLLGIGHLMRAAAIARAFDRGGWQVDLVSGGVPLPHLDIGGARLCQLPPLRTADTSFRTLVTADGEPATEADTAARAGQLLDLFHGAQPNVLMTEHFPFGRRQLRSELLPLLAAARELDQPPLVCSSVRDILVERSAKRHAEAEAWLADYFDLVLVHGDPALVPFDATCPFADRLGGKLRYTGYLDTAASTSQDSGDGEGEIVVSAGGGAVAEALEDVAVAACAAREDGRPWRLLVGANRPPARLAALQASAPVGLTVERARPDFRTLLGRAAASVSQAGYNTVVDLLTSGAPAVLAPFAAEGETEQTLRATRLAEINPAVTVLPEHGLNAGALNAAIDRVLAAVTEPLEIAIDDGAGVVEAVASALAARTQGAASRAAAR